MKHTRIPTQQQTAAQILVVTVLACLVSVARAETEEKLDKTFPVTPGGTLTVDVDFGSIEVSTNADNQAKISVWRKVTLRSQEEEQEFLRDRPVSFTQDGNTVTVRSKAGATLPRSGKGPRRTEAKWIFSVPAQFNVQLRTGGGPIVAGDLTGDLKAHTSGGNLMFTRLHGPVDAHTSGGPIRVLDCDGVLKVNTSGGGIDVAGGGGSLDGHTSGGPVSVKDFRGPIRVKTSGGGIQIENVAGKIEGSTSGGPISAALPSLSEEVELSTSGGGVTLRAPDTAAFDLDASTAGGRVSSDLPVTGQGKPSPSRLKGPVNGGGKSVVLRSTGGNVRIEKF